MPGLVPFFIAAGVEIDTSILEIADTHASETDILTRESYWMKALRSRSFGLN